MKLYRILASAALLIFTARIYSVEVIVDAQAASMYVDRGLQRSDFVFHPALEASVGNLYGGFWSALPFEKKDEPFFTDEEYDFYAGYGWAVSSKVGFDLGVTYTHEPSLSEHTEAYAGIFAELGTFSPSLYIYNDFDLDLFTIEAATSAVVPLQSFPFEAQARIGHVEGDERSYSYFGLDLLYPIRLGASSELTFGLHYAGNDFDGTPSDSSLYGSAGFSFGF